MDIAPTVNLDFTQLQASRVLDAIGIYWLVHGQNQNPCFIDFEGLATSRLGRFGCTTLGALTLMVIFGCTCESNVICIMFFITRFVELINGSICMSKMFIGVCCASSFKMMILGPIVGFIRVNGIFGLSGVNTMMEPIDYMGMCWSLTIEECTSGGGGVHRALEQRGATTL